MCQLLGQNLMASVLRSGSDLCFQTLPHAAFSAFPPLSKAKAKLPLSLPAGLPLCHSPGRPLLPLPGCKDHGNLCLH